LSESLETSVGRDYWRRTTTIHPIHDTVLRFIVDAASATFETLALDVFAHQFECIPAYRRVCEQHGKTPATVRDWRDIPPVPALAFKHLELRCGPAERTFVSSGTTQGPEQRSRHGLPDLRLYHAAAISGLKEFLFPDVPNMRILSLVPSAAEQPDSSLSQMVAWAIETFGAAGSAVFAANDRFEFSGFGDALRSSGFGDALHSSALRGSGEPVCIMTTTGALMRFFDHCRDAGWSFRLPHSSRLMDTGGTKGALPRGAPRVLSRNGLLQAVWNTFAIPGYFVVNEYGMSELSSQYYDNVIRDRQYGRGTHRAKAGPHWMRRRVLDPATLRDVTPGEPGLLCHVDLANAGTALAVLTEDIGREVKDGFEVIGRAAGAEARGCSLALAGFQESPKSKV
jgi:hypothetical protein